MFSIRLGLASVLLIALNLLGSSSQAIEPRGAAPKCTTAAGQVKSVTLSSVKTGDTVTVCAAWLVAATGTGNGSANREPAPPKKVDLKPQTTVKQVPQRRFMSATPNRPFIKTNVFESITPGAQALLASTATRHQHLALLLGKPTQLRFTPVSYRWTLGDGTSSTRSQIRHRYKTPGRYTVRMSVTYASDVRVLPKSQWIRLPYLVTRVAPERELVVAEQPPAAARVAVLVGKSCAQHPLAFGC